MTEAPKALQSLVAMTAVYSEYEVAARMLAATIGTDICVMCGKCCEKNTPFAYGVEAANVVSYLLGIGKLYGFQRRIEDWLLEKHKQCPTYEPLKENKFSFGLDDKIRDEALALSQTRCPFTENKLCLIHDFRPLVCRAYGVTRNGADCQRPLGTGEMPSRHRYIGGQLQADLKAEVHEALNRVPKPNWKRAGFLPTLIYAHTWPESFAKMVSKGLIATAKLIMTEPSMAVIWQEQVESMSEKDMVIR